MDRGEFILLIDDLKSANTEELIIEKINLLVRKFEPYMYKELILANPYYKDIFLEIKENVILDLLSLKDDIKKEISSIKKDIIDHPDEDELKNLKDYCISLLEEVDCQKIALYYPMTYI